MQPRVVHLSNLCTEILEVTNDAETAVCNLGSINLGHFVVVDPDTGVATFDFERLGDVARTAVQYLDRVIDINYYPTDEAGASNSRWRPVGLGVMGLQDVFFRMRLPFDSPEARDLSRRIAEEIYFNALSASCDIAAVAGPHPAFAETRLAGGKFQFELAGHQPDRRRALGRLARGASPSTACATRCSSPSPRRRRSPRSPAPTSASSRRCPTCSSARRCRASSCRSTPTSCATCRSAGCGPTRCAMPIKRAEGSVQGIDVVPDDVKALYRTAWELPMRSLIDMAAERGAFIDQSQSLNLFIESPTIGKLSSMYLHAWKQGLKTTYYLRSRPATRITQTTTNGWPAPGTGRHARRRRVADQGRPDGPSRSVTRRPSPAPSRTPKSCEVCT